MAIFNRYVKLSEGRFYGFLWIIPPMTFSQALLSVASRWPAQPVSSDPSSQSCPCGDVPPVECPSASSTWNRLDADFGRSKWSKLNMFNVKRSKQQISEETWGEVSRLLNTYIYITVIYIYTCILLLRLGMTSYKIKQQPAGFLGQQKGSP